MQTGTYGALEFDRIVEVVRGLALTPLGARRLDELCPLIDVDAVRTALATTTECVRYLDANAPFALEAPSDLESALSALSAEAQPLDPDQLLGLADYLSSIARVHLAVSSAADGPFPALHEILADYRPFDREIAAIRSAIDRTHGVVDDASPELKSIREHTRRQRKRLRGTLDSYLRGRSTAKYLQEQVITERNGRFVLIVKAEHRSSIPGIVHGSSGTGASLFLEPLSTVEINNEIVGLEQQEHAEVMRILRHLSDAFRTRAADLHGTVAAATTVDVVQARATFSRLVDGVEPDVMEGGQAPALVEWRQARHPLLLPAVRRRLSTRPAADPDRHDPSNSSDPVAVDLALTPPTTALVISGPNTGGKTVALKTVGLLSQMAQAGLHVPAAPGSRTTVFQSVFADIGDEQSITASLSTFSGHIASLVAIDQQLRLPALVLLDELGAGTDPIEGGALAAAVTEHFRQRGALLVVTTHNDTLKSYAATTDGVVCAGFGFDATTYAPTYRLNYGSPGRSLALEIAARLGMASTIIDAAEQRRSARETQLAEHLAKVEADLQRIEHDTRDLADSRERLRTEQDRLAADRLALEKKEAQSKERLQGGVDRHVKAARLEIDEVVRTLRENAARLEKRISARTATGRVGLSTGDTGALKADANAALKRIAKTTTTTSGSEGRVSAPADRPTDSLARLMTGPTRRPRVGGRVLVRSLRLEGRLRSIQGSHAEVEVRGKRLRTTLADLNGLEDDHAARGSVTAQSTQAATPGHQAPPEPNHVTVHMATDDGPVTELNVIGCTVDEACDRVEKHLDRALLQSQREVRIIHGHGTGRLRRSIAGLLEEHPEVDQFAAAPAAQGGEGATQVVLRH